MIIEIDRKKIERGKKIYRRMIIMYIFFILLILGIELLSWIEFGSPPDTSQLVVVLTFLCSLPVFGWIVRRSQRQVRTDHHLHLDEVGVTFVTGHERIDIPWGDIKKINYPSWFHSSLTKKNQHKNSQIAFTLHLRPDTPYNKRKYRIYNDYEMSIHDLAEHVEELWFAGRNKMKTTTL